MTQFVMPRQVESVAALRALTKHRDMAHAFIRPSRDVYIFDEGEATADDGFDFVKPTDVVGDGRYVRYIKGSAQELFPATIESYGGGVGAAEATNDAALAAAVAAGRTQVSLYGGGQYDFSAQFTFPDRNFDLLLGPETTLSWGANVVTFFKQPNGLTAKRRHRVIGGKILGGDVAGQVLIEQADANSRGVVHFIDVALISNIRTILYQSAGDASYVQDKVVRAFFTRTKLVPPIDSAVLLQTAAGAGTYGYPVAVYFEDSHFWSELAPGQKGWAFDYDGDILCKGYVSGTLKGACKCDGLTTKGQVFALNGATADGTDSLECKGVTYDSADEIGNAYLDNIILKLSANSFIMKYAGLSSRSKIVLNAPTISVVKPRIFFSSADADFRIDVLVGADNCEIDGGHLEKASTALIRTAAQKTRVNGVDFNAAGGTKTVQDTGAGDYTIGVGNTGVSTGGGLNLAANSRITIGDFNFA